MTAIPNIEHLSSEEQAELEELLSAQYDVEPLDEFIARTTPRFPSPDHVEPVRRVFERARHGEVNALLSMPPRHAKSFTIKSGLAWIMANDPVLTHAYVTSGQRLSEQMSRDVQRRAIAGGVQLASKAVDNWTTTAGGGLLATSIGGPYTGMGTTGVQIIDDPYRDAKQAHSAAWQSEVGDWYDSVARHRVQPGGSRIVLHTRWTPNDLIGRLIRDEPHRWEVINLPAISGFNESAADAALEALKRGETPDYDAIGQSLWPDYWPVRELVDKMASKYFWWSQFMGEPRIRGQALFGDPARFTLSDFKLTGKRAAIFVDPAFTAKTSADHSVIGVFAMEGYGPDAKMYVLSIQRLQVAAPQLVDRILATQRQWGLEVFVEAVGAAKSVPDTLKSIDKRLRVHSITPDRDKYLRAQPAAAAWSIGSVMVPTDARWVPEFLDELQAFTGVQDAHDDQVDVVAYAWDRLYKERPQVRMGSRRGAELPFG